MMVLMGQVNVTEVSARGAIIIDLCLYSIIARICPHMLRYRSATFARNRLLCLSLSIDEVVLEYLSDSTLLILDYFAHVDD